MILIFLFSISLWAQPPESLIRLNQLGYYPRAPKIAVVVGQPGPGDFYIRSTDRGDTVYKGNLGPFMQSKNSSLRTRIADFTPVQQSGSYVILIPGLSASYRFRISAKIHSMLAVSSLKGFYYQRVSMPLESPYAGKWARAAGHPDTAVLVHASAASPLRPAGTVIASPGGWYDAGDYNKYIVNSGISMGTLLSAYEDFPFYFDTLNTNIPESGDALPDILNEINYNLQWMLTMQDPADGGVYHKCTNAAFDGMLMPGVTRLPRYVVQKGTAATLDFAAVMAQAARIFSRFPKQLPGLSAICLNAAIHAWAWAKQNPSVEYDQQAMNSRYQPKISTGAYGDKHFSDEFFWAACELFATTSDEQYYPSIKERLGDPFTLPSWGNVLLLGHYTLIRNEKKLPKKHSEDLATIKTSLVDFANGYLQAVQMNAFQTVMGQNSRDFVWGSNAVAANQSIALVNAWLITKDKKFLDGALSNLDYLLGRNATGYAFITGIGSRSPMHPHHRPSVADGIIEPVPGLLVGGPNPGMQDHCNYPFKEPETAYVDDDCAYASNEIAINWNAPLAYLANALEAIQYTAGYSMNSK